MEQLNQVIVDKWCKLFIIGVSMNGWKCVVSSMADIHRVHKKTPQYGGIVIKILGKPQWIFFTTGFNTFVHCVQKFVETWCTDHILLQVLNYTLKTQFTVTIRTTRSVTCICNEAVWSFINCHSVQNVLRPPSHTHARRPACYWVTAALMISWSNLDHSCTSRSMTCRRVR